MKSSGMRESKLLVSKRQSDTYGLGNLRSTPTRELWLASVDSVISGCSCYSPFMDDVRMVVKSANKKKLMDLGVPEEVAHLLADDRKWDDVKILNKLEVKYIMEGAGTPFPVQGYSPDLVDEVYEKIQGTWVAPVTAKPYLWNWWNPYEVQRLIDIYRDGSAGVALDEGLDRMVGAPILQLGFIYRSGINTKKKYKCPMLQLGIVERVSPQHGQGYILEVKWIKNVIPKAAVINDTTLPSWIRDAVNRGAQHNVWDPNPNPKEWKRKNPGWKHGTGFYAPARLLHNDNYTNNKIDQMADVFVILLSAGDASEMVNPSNVESFSKSYEGEWYADLGDIRSAFEEWSQGYAFDEAFKQIVPQYKRLQIQWAINWTNFDKHIGV